MVTRVDWDTGKAGKIFIINYCFYYLNFVGFYMATYWPFTFMAHEIFP